MSKISEPDDLLGDVPPNLSGPGGAAPLRRVVVSAVNLSEGGPLTVLRACLASARKMLPDTEIIALVHQAHLIDCPGVTLLPFPAAKQSWLNRIKVEYFTFRRLAADLKPDFWLSLHDTSPRLNGVRQAVYCHNPAPFSKPTIRDIYFEPQLLAYRLLYPSIYRFNITANSHVVVQQEWLRRLFSRKFRAPGVIVAHPDTKGGGRSETESKAVPRRAGGKFIVLYPSLPRAFKNLETVAAAAEFVERQSPGSLELRLTISGNENRYARHIAKRFANSPAIRLIGVQSQEQMKSEYAACDLVVFPSRLETWGLPITEAKMWHKPLLVADLPYAHETVGDYDKVRFAGAHDRDAWQRGFLDALSGKQFGPHTRPANHGPLVQGWDALWQLFISQPSGGMGPNGPAQDHAVATTTSLPSPHQELASTS